MKLNTEEIDNIINNLLGFIETHKQILKGEQIFQFYNSINILKKMYHMDVILVRDKSIEHMKNIDLKLNDAIEKQNNKLNDLEMKIQEILNKVDTMLAK